MWYDKSMKKILSFIMAVMLGATVTAATFPAGNVSAATCESTFLGLRPWYMGLSKEVNGSCMIKSPTEIGSEAKFVWTIILNISADISLLVGYVAIIFVIYGGFKYIISTGEPSGVAFAKKTITNALIGLVISVLATVIVNTIIMVLGSNASGG